jgi:ectoine hydroxylase-related dioxygenase (phytanoyl-CoA dioxygenase family)
MAKTIDKSLLSDGAVVIRGLFDHDAMARIEELYNYCLAHPSVISQSLGGGDEFFFNDNTNPDPEVRALTEKALEGQPIGDLLAEVWGSEHVWYLSEETFHKGSGRSGFRTALHQDTCYAHYEGEHWVNFWICLDPVARENSLEVIKGTHLGPLYDCTAFDPKGPRKPMWGDKIDPPWPLWPDFEADLAQDPNSWEVLSWDVEPGDVVVCHPHGFHGGAATGPKTPFRRTITFRFFGDKSYYKWYPGGGANYSAEQEAEQNRQRTDQRRGSGMQPGDLWRSPHFLQLR